MIDKANVIYNRWSAGCGDSLQTVVLGPGTSDVEYDSKSGGGGTNAGGSSSLQHMDHYGISSVNTSQYGVEQQQQPPPQAEPDPFARFHPRLVQCIAEVRQRAKSLLLSRNASQQRTWGPTPVIHSPCSPVLPPEVPQFARLQVSYDDHAVGSYGYAAANSNGMPSSASFYQHAGGGAALPWAPSTSTINFELGAMNDQSWMAFF